MYGDGARNINISDVESSEEEIILRPRKLQKQKGAFESDVDSESCSETADKKFPELQPVLSDETYSTGDECDAGYTSEQFSSKQHQVDD